MVTPVVGRPLTQVVFSEAKRNWPFVFGFGVTLAIVTKLSMSLDRQYLSIAISQTSSYLKSNVPLAALESCFRF